MIRNRLAKGLKRLAGKVRLRACAEMQTAENFDDTSPWKQEHREKAARLRKCAVRLRGFADLIATIAEDDRAGGESSYEPRIGASAYGEGIGKTMVAAKGVWFQTTMCPCGRQSDNDCSDCETWRCVTCKRWVSWELGVGDTQQCDLCALEGETA